MVPQTNPRILAIKNLEAKPALILKSLTPGPQRILHQMDLHFVGSQRPLGVFAGEDS